MMIRSVQRKLGKLATFARMLPYKKSLRSPTPTFIEIEPTTRCNATCGTCSRSSIASDKLKVDLSLTTTKKILETFPDLTFIRLIGLGEVFLNPQIEDILKLFKERSIKVWIITNGSLLRNEKVRRLIHQYIYDVGISIDSTEKEAFKEIRPMGKIGLDEVLAGIQLLIKERNERKSNVIIGIHNTTNDLNYQNIPDLGSLCIHLGVDYLAVGFMENWLVRGDPNYQETADRIHTALQYIPFIKKTLKQQQWRLALRGILLGYKLPKRRIGKCAWPYRSVHITAAGDITPCCARTQPSHSMFNINNDNFAERWNGTEYQALRLAHIKKDTLNSICGNCPL